MTIGNAMVDIIAGVDEAFLATHDLTNATMMLVSDERSRFLRAQVGDSIMASGGSVANTSHGLASLGGRAGFIGKIADDDLGDAFSRDLFDAGVSFFPAPKDHGLPTGRCVIVVTPDGQRTMNTFLGASQYLPTAALDEAAIADAEILYLEGYLWDPEEPRAAMRRAIAAAKSAGRKVAFTLSDAFVIDRHGDDFRAMIDGGEIDILFANHIELASLTGQDDFHAGIDSLKDKVPLLVVTRSEQGAVAASGGKLYEVPAEPVAKVVDTTGAGDLFAAGFLYGHVNGRAIDECLTMGAVCAAEIISHYGARPEASLTELVARRLG